MSQCLAPLRALCGAYAVGNIVSGKPQRSALSEGCAGLQSVRHDGRPRSAFAALGSPGGSAILAYNAKTLVGLLDWKLSLSEAIGLPNLFARGDTFYGEVTRFAPEILTALEARGVKIQSGRGEESGLHGIVVRGHGNIDGAADPRREGQWRTVSP